MRWAIRAHMDGALDFRVLRRYNRGAVLVRRGVYAEYGSREQLDALRAALGYRAAILPIAKNRDEANRKYSGGVQDYIALLDGRSSAVVTSRADELKRQWERLYGVKWGSAEFERMRRDQEFAWQLDRKQTE